MNERTMAAMLDEECRETLEAVSQSRVQTEEAAWQLKKLAQLNELRMNERKLEMDEVYREREAHMVPRALSKRRETHLMSPWRSLELRARRATGIS